MTETRDLLEHTRWLRGLARALVRDESRADDLAQEAWLCALRTGVRRIADLRAWLAKALLNRVRMEHRAGRRREARELLAARPEAEAATDDVVGRMLEHKRMLALVEALEEPYRTAIL